MDTNRVIVLMERLSPLDQEFEREAAPAWQAAPAPAPASKSAPAPASDGFDVPYESSKTKVVAPAPKPAPAPQPAAAPKPATNNSQLRRIILLTSFSPYLTFSSP